MKRLPKGLKTWFNIHIFADLLFGIPLFLFPVQTLTLFNWSPIDPTAARLLGAGLIGIATLSWKCNQSGNIEAYRAALAHKSLWSILAFLAVIYSALTGGPKFSWFIAVLFLVFGSAWNYYRIRL